MKHCPEASLPTPCPAPALLPFTFLLSLLTTHTILLSMVHNLRSTILVYRPLPADRPPQTLGAATFRTHFLTTHIMCCIVLETFASSTLLFTTLSFRATPEVSLNKLANLSQHCSPVCFFSRLPLSFTCLQRTSFKNHYYSSPLPLCAPLIPSSNPYSPRLLLLFPHTTPSIGCSSPIV